MEQGIEAPVHERQIPPVALDQVRPQPALFLLALLQHPDGQVQRYQFTARADLVPEKLLKDSGTWRDLQHLHARLKTKVRDYFFSSLSDVDTVDELSEHPLAQVVKGSTKIVELVPFLVLARELGR